MFMNILKNTIFALIITLLMKIKNVTLTFIISGNFDYVTFIRIIFNHLYRVPKI